MKAIWYRSIFLVGIAGCLMLGARGQSSEGASTQASTAPHGLSARWDELWRKYTGEPGSPFPLDGRGASLQQLEFRTQAQMTPEDARVAEGAQVAIEERAARQGFNLNRTVGAEPDGWEYEQAVCPVFPDHLILEYSRDRGHGDISLFSAVVPRGGQGHVRVIPVRRRSYSLWTPTPTNALTLNDFNHMVKESPNGLDPDWLTLGLCYAALAGGHVRAALAARAPAEEHYPLFHPAMLRVLSTTGVEVRFADVTPYTAPKAKAMDWVMSFAQDGRLLKVKHQVADEIIERPLPQFPAQ
jgi:hypothetical protein